MCGSLPTGALLGRFAGVNVRASGSGNTGATNVARTVGLRWGLVTLLVDAAKGALPVLIAVRLGFGVTTQWLVGLAAFYGHIFSVFSRFRGGKGVATAAGVFAALAPEALAVALAAFLVVATLTRVVSAASLAAALALPLAVGLTVPGRAALCSALAVALTIALAHRENVRRLLAGTEAPFSPKRD